MGKKFVDHGKYIELILTGYKHNGHILFDCDDFEMVKSHQWTINEHGYAICRPTPEVKNRKTLWMHRHLMKYNGEKDIDHINGNKLDNRKENLRICTRAENLWNTIRQKHKMHNISRTNGGYRVEVMRNGKRFRSNCFKKVEDAICLRDKLYATLEKNINQMAVIEKSIKTGVI